MLPYGNGELQDEENVLVTLPHKLALHTLKQNCLRLGIEVVGGAISVF